LARTAALSADIAHLLDVSEESWSKHPVALEFVDSPPAPFVAYTSRLRQLAANEPGTPGPAGLLSHAYVRYLGDLSGGQFLRRRIAKAYGLDEETSAGIEFYDFGTLDGKRRGNMGDLKKVKEWYRDGMNAGAGDDQKLKGKRSC
jgi:heme oxygenase (biliverdin-producing, ferredoxin)